MHQLTSPRLLTRLVSLIVRPQSCSVLSPNMSAQALQAVVPGGAGAETTQFLTLSPDAEPMRLESICMQCMKNVRNCRIRWSARWFAQRNVLRALSDTHAPGPYA